VASIAPNPGKDTYLSSASATSNYGSQATFDLGYYSKGTDNYRVLLEFDITAIPAGSTIDSATLDLYCSQATGTADACSGYRITRTNWVELEATWNKFSTAGGNWTTAGGDYDATTPTPFTFTLPTTTGAKSYSCTAFVQDALDNRSGIVEILLRKNTESAGGYVLYHSDEGTTKPVLTVNYTTAVARRRIAVFV